MLVWPREPLLAHRFFFLCGRNFLRGKGWRLFIGIGERMPPQEGMLSLWAFALEIDFGGPFLQWGLQDWCLASRLDVPASLWTGRERELKGFGLSGASFSLEIDGIRKTLLLPPVFLHKAAA